MPNGGTDNCGECPLFSDNYEITVSDKDETFRLPHCKLRRIAITHHPFYTYCENILHVHKSKKAEPVGPVYIDGGTYPYSRKVWITEAEQNILMKDQEVLAAFFKRSFDLDYPDLGDEFGYSILPLCVIDALFSIGVNYNSTKKVVERFREMFCRNPEFMHDIGRTKPETVFTINGLIALYEKYGIEGMVDKVYKNQHRTSSNNGILKAEAVLNFSRVLLDFGVDRLEDVEKIIGNYDFEKEIKKIPGQRSGISLNYFYILAGAKDYVVPGRMVKRFVRKILGRQVKEGEFQPLIFGASLILEKEYPKIRACILDHLIWKYQRELDV